MRKPLTSIGEIGICGEREYMFRPSLAAMGSLGSPAEIVKMFVSLNSGPVINPFWPAASLRSFERDLLSLAYDVLVACCDDDVTPLLGHMGSKWGSFIPGAMPSHNMVPLAQSLMKHGVVGGLPVTGKSKGSDDFTTEFHARDFVSQAVAHLGMTVDAAWNMTMTEFCGAMKAKYGEPEKKAPNVEKHKAAMSRLAEINKLRKHQVKA
jgi:hypothetical protein